MRSLILIILLASPAYAREELTLTFRAEVQSEQHTAFGDHWLTLAETEEEGISGLQVYLDPSKIHRIKFTVSKPNDLKGTFKVRTPLRSDGVTMRADVGTSTIILGPQPGCQPGDKRCEPFTLNEVGLVELRMDIELAEQSSFGTLVVRPYDVETSRATRPAITFRDEDIPCGTTVPKGWWIFASRLNLDVNPIDTISLCVHEPDGDTECSGDGVSLSVRANKIGRYEFINWNTAPTFSRCFIEVS